MQQPVFSRQNLDERAESHDRADLTFVYLADLGHRHDSLDTSQGSLQRILVLAENIDEALVVLLGDRNRRTGALLNFLNHLAARTDHRADEILRNDDLLDARHMRFELRPRSRNRLKYLAKNM